ncbi:MAG: DNA/RNA non-specific endonuclease [Clostridia bacterium]|nr:DNA/RNA non-specific endonuclease [Clostridia bacterium]
MKRFLSLALVALVVASALICGCVPSEEHSIVIDQSRQPEIKFDSSAVLEYVSSADESEDENESENSQTPPVFENAEPLDPSSIPYFTGSPYCVINDNIPSFSQEELTVDSYEFYASLDSLGRCGITVASIGKDLMPTEERGNIGMVKPTGWHTVKYDFVDGKYLYNRCHLIGFQLTGENANTRNLITGTRYMNVQGMLPFENMVADYIKETDNHVAYRVTPIFNGNDLLALGVQMEAFSVEDEGDGICFNVFCYNVQPGVLIDYSSGESALDQSGIIENESDSGDKRLYILNTSSKKFHYPDCSGAKSISEKNYAERTATREEIIEDGYDPCGICKP